jgi:dipeptidyl aminopeptidase/acylaminoacyl peptidase
VNWANSGDVFIAMRSALGLVAVLVLAGCTSSTAAPAASTAPSTSAPAATTAEGDTAADPVPVQHLTFTAKDGTMIDWVLLVPPGREKGTPGKVLFAFPPGGQDLDVTTKVLQGKWGPEAMARGWVVASPAAPSTGLYYDDASAKYVPELLDVVAKDYPPEGGRFDLGGVSNGGLSAFKAALSYPDRFRSLTVFPGYSPDGGNDPNLAKLAKIGVAMFVGGNDSGWLEPSQQTQAALKKLGDTVELHVVPNEGHIIQSLTSKDLFDAMERVRN